jgi:hypothetical protein
MVAMFPHMAKVGMKVFAMHLHPGPLRIIPIVSSPNPLAGVQLRREASRVGNRFDNSTPALLTSAYSRRY